MEKIHLHLENCYGIKKLEKDFDFSSGRTYAVYAPNGVMKTSFAKTFEDVSSGQVSKDLIFPERTTIREITKESSAELTKDEVFVIEPYKADFSSEKMSTLLVNKSLKSEYDSIHVKIDEEKDKLLRELKELSGLRDEIDKEISQTFTSDNNKLFVSLERVEKEVLDASEPNFFDISYKEIFNEKVLKFLETKDFKKKIADYIKKYEELIVASKYFKKGVFNHNNASAVAKHLVDNGFFEAEHSLSLNSKDSKSEIIHTKEDLERVVEAEKNAILNNPDLVKAFEDIDKALNKNEDLRQFRDYLSKNEKIIVELENLGSFRQKLWISYLKKHKELYEIFLKEYRSGREGLNKIIEQAKTERTHWKNVIDIFNKRFSVPFILTIKNQDDVILKREVPSIGFVFKDSAGETTVEEVNLLQALSSGEKRALYILNIIFEVEARKETKQETLFIVDDIADSFDYKNKYAIIEYLKDISEEKYFRQIILTHNFDFFRTIQSRFIPRKYCLMVEKKHDGVELVDAAYMQPFEYWMKHLDEDKKLVASIPFVRNLIEYTRGTSDTDYAKLTCLLHIKSDSDSILKSDLETIYKNVFPGLSSLSLTDGSKKVIDLIFSLADECLTATEGINLENKILLAVAIRLKAEKFMISKLSDKSEPGSKQTRVFFDRFKAEFGGSEPENVKLLEQVNLMTPENIHFNSFMYEPILDMSDEHLKNLYNEVKKLI